MLVVFNARNLVVPFALAALPVKIIDQRAHVGAVSANRVKCLKKRFAGAACRSVQVNLIGIVRTEKIRCFLADVVHLENVTAPEFPLETQGPVVNARKLDVRIDHVDRICRKRRRSSKLSG